MPDLKITSNIKAGQNRLDKDAGTDSSKTYGNLSIYYRPNFLARLNQGTLFIKALINDFGYSTPGRNFRETSVTAGFNVQL